jgi:hypothetical protein
MAARGGGRQAIADVFGGRSMKVGWFALVAAERANAQAERDSRSLAGVALTPVGRSCEWSAEL